MQRQKAEGKEGNDIYLSAFHVGSDRKLRLNSFCVYWNSSWRSFCSSCFTSVCLFVCVCVCVRRRGRMRAERKGREGSGVLLDGLTHIQAHLHAVPGVVWQRLGQPGHAVVTVAQDLDPHALVFLKRIGGDETKSASGVNYLAYTSPSPSNQNVHALRVRSNEPKTHTPTHTKTR